jgi:hypothetical protein
MMLVGMCVESPSVKWFFADTCKRMRLQMGWVRHSCWSLATRVTARRPPATQVPDTQSAPNRVSGTYC